MQLIVGVWIVLLDQLSKQLLAIQATHNPGIAFGWLVGQPVLASALIGLVLFGLLGYYLTHRPHRAVTQLSWTLLLAGVASNLIDRFRLGVVIDPLSVGSWFPNFNLADCAVIVGLIVLGWLGRRG